MNLEQTSRRTLVESARFIVDQVRAVGLEPEPGSRVMEMYRVMTSPGDVIPPDHPDFPTALEAYRDLQLLGFIFSQLNTHREQPRFQKLVKLLLKDSVLPQHDRENSHGRDTQFELYLAAICQNAGLVPVGYEEPDVTFVFNGTKHCIAAKRLKSLAPLSKHVKKAAEQIAKRGLPGVVALDLSFAFNCDNRPLLATLQDEEFEALLDYQSAKFFYDHQDKFLRWVAGKGVRAVVVFDSVVRLLPDQEWCLVGSSPWLMTTPGSEEAKREFQTLFSAFNRGVPHLTQFDQ